MRQCLVRVTVLVAAGKAGVCAGLLVAVTRLAGQTEGEGEDGACLTGTA